MALGLVTCVGGLGNCGRRSRICRLGTRHTSNQSSGEQMTTTLAFSRPMLRQHALAALVMIGAGVGIAAIIGVDRAAPLRFEAGEILPDPAKPGTLLRVRWRTQWLRKCEGVNSRELVGSDAVIRPYAKYVMRIPAFLGEQTADTEFWLPWTMPSGPTTYRAVIRFDNCGYTSRWWPIEVRVPDVQFTTAAQ